MPRWTSSCAFRTCIQRWLRYGRIPRNHALRNSTCAVRGTSRWRWPRASAVSKKERLRAAIVQMKPSKGRYEANLQFAREAFAQLAPDAPDLVVFPEAAMTGYFLEGAVFDLARTASDFAADLAAQWRASSDAPVDLVAGFYENDAGTYYNSAM